MNVEQIPPKLSSQPPVLVSWNPEGEANHCHRNVRLKVLRDGGKALRGWVIAIDRRNRIALAVDHSVWQNRAGEMIGITPVHPDARDFPTWGVAGKTYFVPADQGARVTDRCFALSNNNEVKRRAIRMNRVLHEADKVRDQTGIDPLIWCGQGYTKHPGLMAKGP